MKTPEQIPINRAESEDGSRRSPWSVFFLIVVTALAFVRICGNDFSWWDDQYTLHHNPYFNPVTFETLRFYWTHPEHGLYMPVTQTVWAFLATLAYVGRPDEYGVMLNPSVFHVASVLLHLGSSVFVLQILRRLVGKEIPAVAGALFFALHPVQVESLAWASGMKDLLCWFFSLAALLLYVRRAQRDGGRSLWRGVELPAAVCLLLLAVLSKPTAMVTPAAMLVVDGLLMRRRWSKSLLDLVPFFVLAMVAALLARDAQYENTSAIVPRWQRPFVAGHAFAFYFGKVIWPATLSLDYGRSPVRVMAEPLAYVWWLVPGLVALATLWLARRRGWRMPLAALLLFAIGIAPVSGLAVFQMQLYSTVTDHYLYFSLLGPALLVAWALSRWRHRFLRVVMAMVLLALGVRTYLQTAVWRDAFALFGHAFEIFPDSYMASGNLASMYLSRTPPDAVHAEPLVDRAYATAPNNFYVLNNYAMVKSRLGKRAEGIAAWEKCRQLLRSGPLAGENRAAFLAQISVTLLDLDEFDLALDWAEEAIGVDPRDPSAASAITTVRRVVSAHRAATRPATTTAPNRPPSSQPT